MAQHAIATKAPATAPLGGPGALMGPQHKLTLMQRPRRGRRSLFSALAILSVIAVVLSPASATWAQDDTPAEDAFSDDDGSVHEPALNALANLGYLAGTECEDNNICPTRNLQRWELAVWLGRALTNNTEPPETTTSRFEDVNPAQWWAAHVERFAQLQITTGCKTEPLSYCPYNSVTRAQMASFLKRAYQLPQANNIGFTDIQGNTHAANINALAAARITTGCNTNPLNYCPTKPVTRAQMATFIARATGLINKPPVPKPPSTYKAISTSGDTNCTIRTNGTITCWGNITTNPPQGTYKTFANNSPFCAIRTDNTIACWEPADYYFTGISDVPDGTFKMLTVGTSHACGIRTNNTVTCWGDGLTFGESAGIIYDPPTGTFKTVASGDYHTCGIRSDNTVECWGIYFKWDDDESSTDARTHDIPEGAVKSISVSRSHNCVVRTNDTIYCWGDHLHYVDIFFEVPDVPSGTFKAVAAGSLHACAIRSNDTVVCWSPRYDVYGDSSFDEISKRAASPDGKFKTIALASEASCGIHTDDTLTCWGDNGHGQSDAPQGTFRDISFGYTHTCAIRTDDTITCWGYNDKGQTNVP